MELLGAAFDEHTLLSLGYAIERTLKLRQPPFSTPPLVNGKVPAPVRTRASGLSTSLELTYDPTTSRLRFAIAGEAKAREQIAAVWLHSGTREKVGAARHEVFSARTGGLASGELKLTAPDRADLQNGRLSVRFYPRGGGESVTVHLPEVRAWQ
jgi:amidase